MEINGDNFKKNMKLPISIIILTFNEERNIESCLESVCDFVEDIFVVDSFSTDKTLEISRRYTDKIFQHEFENYGSQRNWALNNLPLQTEWVLNLDADHRVSERLRSELVKIFSMDHKINENSFLITRKAIFMDRWIQYGNQYPVYHAVLFRKGSGMCENKLYDQHFLVNGKVKVINGYIENIASQLADFTLRHEKWSTLEAVEYLKEKHKVGKYGEYKVVLKNLFGDPIQKRRYFKELYLKLPLLIRPFVYFWYRYVFKFGFLDGKEGLIFHFLQGLWFRFLVDAKIYEIEGKAKKENKTIQEIIKELYNVEV